MMSESPNNPETATEARARQRREARDARKGQRTPTPVLLLRVVIAIALLAGAPAGVWYTLKTIHADIYSSIGFKTWVRQRELDRGRRILEHSHKLNPHDPLNQFRLAQSIFATETRKVADGQFGNVEGRDLRLALDLFNEAAKARFKPQEAHRRKAQTARLLHYLADRAGDREYATQMAQVSTAEFFLYRRLQGYPDVDVDRFYRDAINSAVEARSYETAVVFYEDFLVHGRARELSRVDAHIEVIAARQFLGEFHILMIELREVLFRDPTNRQALERLQWAVNDADMGYGAWLILRDLQAADKLPPALRNGYEAMRAAFGEG